MTARKAAAFTAPRTRMQAPFISISMQDGSRAIASSAAAMATGTNAGAPAEASAAAFAITCRRQVNNCPRFMPCRRAISDTHAPGSKLSARICALSCALHVRRRATPVITSTRRNSPAIVLGVKLALLLSPTRIISLRFYRRAIIADSAHRRQGGDAITLTLDQIRAAHAAGVAPGVVLADAGYGVNGGFRAGVTALDLPYVVGVQSAPTVWPPGQEPLPAKPWSGHGRKPSCLNRDLEHQPVTVKELALSLKKKAWRSLTWREGSNTSLASRFAAVRLRPASRDYNQTKPHPVEWLIVEWPNEPRSCARRRRILPWRSSTAGPNHEGVHR